MVLSFCFKEKEKQNLFSKYNLNEEEVPRSETYRDVGVYKILGSTRLIFATQKLLNYYSNRL